MIEAMQWDGRNTHEVMSFCPPLLSERFDGSALVIPTSEGYMRASLGDWIIKGVKGEFYPCKPDIFEATYEPAE